MNKDYGLALAQGRGKSANQGLTLLEVVLALTIMALVLAAAGGLFTTGLRLWSQQDKKAELTQVARGLMNRIVGDVQHGEAIVGSGSSFLDIESRYYIDADDLREKVVYTLYEQRRGRRRRGDPQPPAPPPPAPPPAPPPPAPPSPMSGPLIFERLVSNNQITRQEMSRDVKRFQTTPIDLDRDGKTEAVKIELVVGTYQRDGGWEPETFTLEVTTYLRNAQLNPAP